MSHGKDAYKRTVDARLVRAYNEGKVSDHYRLIDDMSRRIVEYLRRNEQSKNDQTIILGE